MKHIKSSNHKINNSKVYFAVKVQGNARELVLTVM